jgi:hypothetical protein
MSSHAPITLPYVSSRVYYPNPLKAPRWILAIFALFGLLVFAALGILRDPIMPISVLCGSVMLAVCGLGLLCLLLLYLPLATSLRIDSTGITYKVSFRRRRFEWRRVRELRLVSLDRTLLHHLRVEIILEPNHQPSRQAIDAQLFGWSPEALVEEMDGWRTGTAGA